ncbi:MAG: hypothetical protein BWX71_01306 [Deltaproteobacteria bacterium ADurb.Bin072]|nr:MAG: hypothetical protein BWX71_01306 [Deltaproteobacteria bacterium ADurb.Bin072]
MEATFQELVAHYLSLYFDEAERTAAGLGREECAYFALKHMGTVNRCHALPVYDLEGGEVPSWVRTLVVQGSRFAAGLRLRERAEKILARDGSDPEAFVDLTLERDDMECFLEAAVLMSHGLIEEAGDNDLLDELAIPASRAIEFDALFDNEDSGGDEELGRKVAALVRPLVLAIAPYPPPSSRAWWVWKSEE